MNSNLLTCNLNSSHLQLNTDGTVILLRHLASAWLFSDCSLMLSDSFESTGTERDVSNADLPALVDLLAIDNVLLLEVAMKECHGLCLQEDTYVNKCTLPV